MRSSEQTPRDGENVFCVAVAASSSTESFAALRAWPLGPEPECETTGWVKMSTQFSITGAPAIETGESNGNS